MMRDVSILAQPGGRALHSRSEFRGTLPRNVSILAQPGGRALLVWVDRSDTSSLTVSILAQPGGRALRALVVVLQRHVKRVSILAQPGGRALPRRVSCPCPDRMFQSSPSPGAGRCAVFYTPGCFFSPRSHVSILAQPGGRALLP